MSVAERRPESAVAVWWWSLDRTALFFILVLFGVGGVLSMTAGPAAAARLDIADPFFFPARHSVYAAIALTVMVAVSTVEIVTARRLAIVLWGSSVVALLGTVLVGVEMNGAKRWLGGGGFTVQPVEFVKPAFVVAAAWLLSEGRKVDGPPATLICFAGLGVVAGLLLLQPDVGQTALITAVFGVLLFLNGASWRLLGGLTALGAVAGAAAFSALPYVRGRIMSFVGAQEGDRYQLEHALEAVRQGGPFGVGPGEGDVIEDLPDAHTDFVFVAAAEEFGAVFCVAIIAVFALLTMRVLRRAADLVDPMARLAASGLVVLIALQALINLSVNLGVAPPKGMTLAIHLLWRLVLGWDGTDRWTDFDLYASTSGRVRNAPVAAAQQWPLWRALLSPLC